MPDFSFKITISLKLIPLDIPVPKAFENASFAANLFAKQFELFFVLLHFIISSSLNILDKKGFFFRDFLNLFTRIMSVPTPNSFF